MAKVDFITIMYFHVFCFQFSSPPAGRLGLTLWGNPEPLLNPTEPKISMKLYTKIHRLNSRDLVKSTRSNGMMCLLFCEKNLA